MLGAMGKLLTTLTDWHQAPTMLPLLQGYAQPQLLKRLQVVLVLRFQQPEQLLLLAQLQTEQPLLQDQAG